MISIAKSGATLVVCSILLTGCSSNSADVSLPKAISTSLKTAIATKRAERVPATVSTAADVAKFDAPVLQINPLKFGGTNFLGRFAPRSDSRGGTVEIWQSSDQAQVFLNKGVLVGTRGVGNDIIATDAAQTINAVTQTRNARVTRRMEISDGDGTATVINLDCAVENLGAETISVAQQALSTTHMRETCRAQTGGEATIENHYWVQSGGRIRKSQQWAGPAVGYFELIPLKT